jgi:3-oxoadipate enol-lactonase
MCRAEGLRLPSTAKGSGPCLMLVHGIGATALSTFGPLLPTLARAFTVVAPDYSKCPPGTDLDGLVDAHVRAAESAGHERFAVAGHSFGVPIALRLATRHPERVTGLVLTAGFACAPPATRLKLHVWRSLLADRELLPRFLMSVMFSDRYLRAMSDSQLDGMAELIALGVDGETGRLMELVLTLDLRAELGRVAAPTLVVATAADQLVPSSTSVELAAAIPRARLTELDCAHHPALECADDWAGLIGQFAGTLTAPERL